MKTIWRSLIFCCIVFNTTALSAGRYIDNDLDGVDDRIDQCLDTPFDQLADERGCSIEEAAVASSRMSIGLQAGITSNRDDNYDTQTLANLYAVVRYDAFDLSLSTNAYNTRNFTGVVDTQNDLYLTLGHRWQIDSFQWRLSGGIIVSTKRDNNDYFIAIDASHTINTQWSITGYYAYTIAGDDPNITYRNYSTLSVGTAYTPTARLYLSLSYNHISPIIDDGEAYRSLSVYGAYYLTDRTYVALTYAYGLSDSAYDHTLSIDLGVTFE